MIAAWDRMAARVRALFRKSEFDEDFAEELSFHVAELTDDNIRRGMSPAEARKAALIALGGLEQTKELHRESRSALWLENTVWDLRYAMRQLAKAPGFSLVVILALAIGIGACTTIYSVMRSTILSPLPVLDQERVFVLWENHKERGIERFSVSLPNYLDFRDQAETVEGLMAWRGSSATVTLGELPERLESMEITPGGMRALGWQPILGREFLASETEGGGARVVMVSESFWRNHLGEDPEVVGRGIEVDRESHEIVGVFSDETYVMNGEVPIWRPLVYRPSRDGRDNHDLTVCGRLKDGITLAQSQADMSGVAARLRKAYPDSNDGWDVFLEPVYDVFVPANLRAGLSIVFASVGMLLLIACANVANLLLSRISMRERELSVRVALGAKRLRVARQLLSESAVYCFFGTMAGVLLAIWGVKLVRAFAPQELPRADAISLSWNGLLFAAAACICVLVLSGLVPALKGTQVRPAGALGSGAKTKGAAPAKARLRSGLVVVQLALSLTLAAGAALLMKSYWRMQQIDLGFEATGVLTFRITPDAVRYGDAGERIRLYQELIARMEAMPGVEAAGLTSAVPLGPGRTALNVFSLEPSAVAPEGSVQAGWRIVSPKYFDTVGIPVLEGRAFNRFDTQEGAPVMLISRELAMRFWPNESALGKRLSPGGGDNFYTVVGVVGDSRLMTVTRSENPAMFFSMEQWWGWHTMNFVVRVDGAPEALIPAIRQLVYEVDPDQPVFGFKTLERYVREQYEMPQLNSWLLGIFAGTALFLAAIGVYGVLASTVSQRANEIGVRMALGARRSEIVRFVVGRGVAMLAIGLGLGGALTWQFVRLVRPHLYGIGLGDYPVVVMAGAVLAVVALAAIALPVMRASRIDPVEALRAE